MAGSATGRRRRRRAEGSLPVQLAISSYSFHRLGGGPEAGQPVPDLGDVIDGAAALGCAGVELLGVHFPSTDRDYLNGLKRRALRAGVQPVAVSAHHNFVTPDVARRRQQVEVVTKWIDVAAALGAPVVRVFGGRWQTAPDFATYMANRGQEPPLPGYSEDDAFDWITAGFTAVLPRAAEAGVVLALENHWGFTGTAAGTLRIIRALDSPWLAAVLDTGNFLEDPYDELTRLAPEAVLVHAKAYPGGGIYYSLDLDYPRIVRLLREAGYRGFLSLENEGLALPAEGNPQALTTLRTALAA